jgi:lipopolysaccharide transport system ATP-binding protein
MMNEQLPVGTIVFENVSKRYRLGALGTLRSTLAAMRTKPADGDNAQRTLWALRDASFRVESGTALGLIGPNGAGKTTTLKLLSNITRPASGRVVVNGRVSSLIELGAGFHPELTGRENIYLNGAILGMRRAEIARKIDDIIAFAELERFIDTPVKRYSSGMYVRLGFAVAAHVEPDILLVDEVMAVGDAQFRQKCMVRMKELRAAGTTLIFVSHNMHMVNTLCDRALVLKDGQILFDGPSQEAITLYEQTWQRHHQVSTPVAAGDERVHISQVELLDGHDQPQRTFKHSECLKIRARILSTFPIGSPVIRVRLLAEDNTVVAMIATLHLRNALPPDWKLHDQTEVTITLPSLEIVTGNYLAEVRVLDATDTEVLASGQSDEFFVQSPGISHETDTGTYRPRVKWSLSEYGDEL